MAAARPPDKSQGAWASPMPASWEAGGPGGDPSADDVPRRGAGSARRRSSSSRRRARMVSASALTPRNLLCREQSPSRDPHRPSQYPRHFDSQRKTESTGSNSWVQADEFCAEQQCELIWRTYLSRRSASSAARRNSSSSCTCSNAAHHKIKRDLPEALASEVYANTIYQASVKALYQKFGHLCLEPLPLLLQAPPSIRRR